MSENGFSGLQQLGSSTSEFNAVAFVVRSLMARMSTVTMAKVIKVTNDGGVAPVGFVDLQPLVNVLDGASTAMAHGTIFHCPYMRIQGGASAVILDPQVGDIGIVAFADRDITSVVANRGVANPGSRRRFDMADALYLGGALNGVPSQYVQFSEDGIVLHSPQAVTLDAPTVVLQATTVTINAGEATTVTAPTFTVNGATVFNGPISQVPGSQADGGPASFDGPLVVTGDVTASGTSLHAHTHGGVQTGTGLTGVPT